jgi:O-antigen/teichoic acid export membrane protein
MNGNFTKQTLTTFATRVLQLIFGIGISIILARVLGPEGKGIFSLAILLPLFLVAFTDFGVAPASVYYIGKKRYSPEEVFGVNIIFSILISILAILIGLIIVFFFGNKLFPGIATAYLLLALSLIPFKVFLVFVVNVLLGLQKIKKYNLVQLIQTLIYLFLIMIFLLGFHFGIGVAILMQVISFLIASIVLFFEMRKEVNIVQLRINKSLFKDFFSFGSRAYLSNILFFLHARIDMFMLNYFLNPAMVGFYSISVIIAEKLWLISQSAGVVIFPRISSETDARQLKKFTPLVARNVFAITLIGAGGLFIIAPWLITFFYSKQYLESIVPFQILLLGIIPVSLSQILKYDFSGRGKPILNTYLNGASLVLNITLNIIFIPKFKVVGAAMATAISYTFASFLAILIYKYVSGNRIRDIIFIKKSDLKYYLNFFKILKIYKGANK